MNPMGSTPVLDKGFVMLKSASPSGQVLRDIRAQQFRGVMKEPLMVMPRVVMLVKCPYAVMTSLASSNLRLIQDLSYSNESEVYEPKVDEIRSGNHQTDIDLSEFISGTVSSLITNKTTLKQDGCDGFVAGLTLPMAAYWQGLVYGDLMDWMKVVLAPHAPKMMRAYQDAFKGILSVEFLDLDEMMKRIK